MKFTSYVNKNTHTHRTERLADYVINNEIPSLILQEIHCAVLRCYVFSGTNLYFILTVRDGDELGISVIC